MKVENAENKKRQMFVGAGSYTSNDNLLMQESIMLNIEPGVNNGGNPAE